MKHITVTLTEQQEKKLSKIKKLIEKNRRLPLMSLGQVFFKGHTQSTGKQRKSKLIIGLVPNKSALQINEIASENFIDL